MIVVGDIPKSITYVYSNTKNMSPGPNWNLGGFFSKKYQELVIPAEVADSLDAKTVNIAKKLIQRLFYKNNQSAISTVILNNDPIKNIRLFCLQKRFGGSNHYKILIDNFLLDVKEDVLIESILTEGVKVGGILQGEFIWAKFGSKLKLIRVGSELYKSILEFKSKKSLPPLRKKELIVGGVYQTIRKDYAIYLGEVDTIQQKSNGSSKFNFNNFLHKRNMLFCNIFSNENPEDLLNSSCIEKDTHRFVIKSSHKFIEKIDDVSVPTNIINLIRDASRKRVKKYILQYSTNKNKASISVINSNYLEYLISNFSKLINMNRPGSSIEVFDPHKYLFLT
jgi:hypothetical protein